MPSNTPNARYKVDTTEFSTVAVCLVPGCGARWLTNTYEHGLEAIANHITRAHRGYQNQARTWLNNRKGAA